jgi:glycosyltransferase involved in cell wall biosynthesis
MQERIAFLMPVYQAQRDFDDTMQSLAETSTPCTVFVVDDGSQPPLELRGYDPRVKVNLTRLQRNQGIVAALNAGLKAALEAGCEYIARIDAGDFVRPDRLARQIAYLENHPRCMLVGSDAEVRDENGAYCFTIEPPREPAALARAMHERAWLLHPSVMYRASVFREIGYYSDEFAAAEDYEMFLRIASRYEVGVVPETLLVYIVRKGSISGRKARVQGISRLRIQLRYLRWTDWFSYYGALRTIGTLLMPHGLKNALKLRFLYSRQAGTPDSPPAI